MENTVEYERKVIRDLIRFIIRKLRLKLREVIDEQTQESLERFLEMATEDEENYVLQNRSLREIGEHELINLIIKLYTALIDTEYSPNKSCLGKRAKGYSTEIRITLLKGANEEIRKLKSNDFISENHDCFCRSKSFFMLFGKLFKWSDEMRADVCM